MSMQVPFVGFQAVRGQEHLPALCCFGFVQVYCVLRWARAHFSIQTLFTRFARVRAFVPPRLHDLCLMLCFRSML